MQDFYVIRHPSVWAIAQYKEKKVLESKLSDGILIGGYQGSCRISTGHAGFLRNPSPFGVTSYKQNKKKRD